MRFTLIKDIKKDRAMRPILATLLAFMFLYLLADIFVKEAGFGLFYVELSSTLFGNEEEFLEPITRASFLEFIHAEIFFIMMLLLTLSAVFVRLSNKSNTTLLVLNLVTLSALSSLIFLALSYFYLAFFLYLYIYTFFIWHLGACYMVLYSLWKLYARTL